jgi:hypothetical protein
MALLHSPPSLVSTTQVSDILLMFIQMLWLVRTTVDLNMEQGTKPSFQVLLAFISINITAGQSQIP